MSSNCCCSRSRDPEGNRPLFGDEKKQRPARKPISEFEKNFESWLTKQYLPVEAAITAVNVAVRGAYMGIIVDAMFEGACSATSITSPSAGGTIRPQVLSFIGGYRPLVESFILGGTLEQARNFAVMMGVNAGLSCVLKRLRGKEDTKTNMVSAFGSGVVLSLVAGMRGPSVMSVGALFALVNGGIFKAEETLAKRRAEDELHNKTSGAFSSISIGLGLDHHAMNFNKGFLTDNTLPLHTDRKMVKKGRH